ncbi:MAG: RnfH family protein [Methylococcaceae bacterium]
MCEPHEADFWVEVAYAKPDEQFLVRLDVSPGTTAESAVKRSGVLERFPEIDLTQNAVGIFAKVCSLQQVLRAGDRVEIYRPLIADPKVMRRQAAR